MLSPNLLATGIPPIPEAKGWGRAYDGRAGPLIDLSQAVPGYPPPPELLERLARSAGDPASAAYGPLAGDPALREAYAEHASRFYGARIAAGEVAITSGCNQAFVITMLALARAGESVMLPTPWYFNHKMALDMLGIAAIPLPCSATEGFVPDAAVAERLIEPGTRAIVLVTPNNPTGAVYPAETIAAFADLCRRRGLMLVLDETYRDFIAAPPHRLFDDPDWQDSLIGLYSFSKSYCIPGHRLGALTASAALMPEIAKILDTLQICPPRLAQQPVAWAMTALTSWREGNRREIDARGAAFAEALRGLNGWHVSSMGAYFAFLRHPRSGSPAREVARALAEERGVLCLPGPYFGPGQEDHLRIAFANAGLEQLAGLRERLAGFV